jgi:hypothetical protein
VLPDVTPTIQIPIAPLAYRSTQKNSQKIPSKGDEMLDNIQEKEILPADDSDRIIPTRIAKLDTHIAFLDDQISRLNEEIRNTRIDRDLLISRAKELHITTDKEYKIIEVPVYEKKRVDIEALKRMAADKYALIIANISAKLEDDIAAKKAKAATFISQADVKAVIKDKAVLAQVIPEPKEPSGYNVTVVKR